MARLPVASWSQFQPTHFQPMGKAMYGAMALVILAARRSAWRRPEYSGFGDNSVDEERGVEDGNGGDQGEFQEHCHWLRFLPGFCQ